MKKTTINHHQLEMLLENWGSFVTTGTWGPRIATECGSAERAWNHHGSRHVWDESEAGGLPRHKAADNALGVLVERMLEDAPLDWRRVLLQRYGHRRTGYRLAVALNTSVAQSEALLVSVKAHVLERLEAVGHA